MARVLLTSERRLAGRLGLLLILALLFAQTGALLHQYSHLKGPGDPPAAGQSCTDCLSFSPLLATAGGSTDLLPLARVQAGGSYRSPRLPPCGRSSYHAFQPRGPPSVA